MTEKIGPVRFRMSEISYAEFIDALEACGVADLAGASAANQARSTVALGWAVARRTRPDFTYEDALSQPLGTFQSIEEDDLPEGSSANGGATPRVSLAHGPSIQQT